jgi:hypothetical protein
LAVTLRLTRKAAGIELWRGRFDVTVDGSSVGTLGRQDTIETPVDPGPHTLFLRMGRRYSSQPQTFDAAEGETVTFRCHGAEAWPHLVASLIAPDLAISLKREED